ncbi:carbon storage regulator CsrA [Oceanirhabdus seepicola]|uniref:Translational regulator CsrA n=1 Tax=Oceanirhabdus seepicola TaxID=2828781 RepID=A0A9J6NUG7_9CLOT|nr:carbon storage regulator CsrA [Oceanirhabdus seepicola]
MLVIKRKKNEGLQIGEDITIKIVGISDNAVKIAIDAPKETIILRSELLEEVMDENKNALVGDLNSLNALKDYSK